MSDDDRLADYLARIDNPNHRRDVDDGCANCNHSRVYCRCVQYIEGTDQRCCSSCSGH